MNGTHDHTHDCDCCGHDHMHDHTHGDCCGHDHCDCGHEESTPAEIAAMRTRLVALTALANDYCVTLEHAAEIEKKDFIAEILGYLPRLYWEFSDIDVPASEEDEEFYLPDFVDEDYYESIRLRVGSLMGEDDVFLETFEEDMKYSDTPIASSVSECLADIFQDLFNFVAAVKDSDGDMLAEAFTACKENFAVYWSQKLCNVMRALNHLRYSSR